MRVRVGRREGRAGMRAVREEWWKSVGGVGARVSLFCGTCVNKSVWDKCEKFILKDMSCHTS